MNYKDRTSTILAILLVFVVISAQSAGAFQWRWMNPLPQGGALYAAWIHNAGEIYWVGENGAMFRYDGQRALSIFTGTKNNLLAVWGIRGGPLFVVGERGAIFFYSQGTTVRMDGGTTDNLYGVWGTSESDVYAVGALGTILHFDGTRWSPQESGTQFDLFAIWGSDPANIYAVGDGGVILHFDGEHWISLESSTTNLLRGIWGTSPEDIYAVGDEGTVIYFDGFHWQSLDTGRSQLNFFSVWAARPDEIFVVGGAASAGDAPAYGAILQYNGRGGSPWPMRLEERNFHHVIGSDNGQVVAVGEAGRVYIRQESVWESINPGGFTSDIRSLWGIEDRLVMASVNEGRVFIIDERGNRETFVGVNESLNDIWGTDFNHVYAVGDAGGIYRFNGIRWASMLSPAGRSLRGIWGSSFDNIYAVGEGSALLHFDGAAWRPLTYNPETHILTDIWGSESGHIFVTGGEGKIWRFNGVRWWVYQDSRVQTFMAVHGSGADNVYAVGTSGYIAHWNGRTWDSVQPPAIDTDLSAVWVLGENDVIVAGDSGKVYRFNGVAWIPLPVAADVNINAIWSANGKILLAGERGAMLWNASLDFPGIALTLNGEVFHHGDSEFTAFLSGFPGRSGNTVDLYVMINLPGGGFINYRTGDNTIEPVLSNFPMVSFAYLLAEGDLQGLHFGNYSIMALLVRAGSDPQDISAWVDWDWAGFAYYDR
ncbi:MAG: hypothetical protein JRG73_04560 [Deltaproteobacteria bacterium]|nr:hypothetical protein [Deltaproteobacteria bacterium]